MTDDPTAQSPIDDTWATVEGEQQGMPIIIRCRTNLQSITGDARWPNRLAIVWPFPAEGEEGQRGLPTAGQQEAMNRFEDAATAGLESKSIAVLVSVATSAGQREWIWYARPGPEFNPAFNAALKGHPKYPLKIRMAPDPQCKGYRGLLRAIGQ